MLRTITIISDDTHPGALHLGLNNYKKIEEALGDLLIASNLIQRERPVKNRMPTRLVSFDGQDIDWDKALAELTEARNREEN